MANQADVIQAVGKLVAVALRSDEPAESRAALAGLVGESRGVPVEFTDCLAVASYALVVEVDDLAGVLNDRKRFELRPLELRYRHRDRAAAILRHASGLTLMLVQTAASKVSGPLLRPALGALFADAPKEKIAADHALLAMLYQAINRTADDLPYTPEFERLYEDYKAKLANEELDHAEVWRHLLTMRKAAKLPKLGSAPTKPPQTTPEERVLLCELLGSDIGRRDRLPYSQKFGEVHEAFNKAFSKSRRRTLSPHLLWRVIATLAK